MKKVFGFLLIAIALIVGTVEVMTVSSVQAVACDGDHRGS
jgi:hypothetical protein